MKIPIAIDHTHRPVYRVVRRDWLDPLDTSYSQRPTADNRWNTPEFPALYCCCSEWAARAVAQDVFRLAGVNLADLQPAFQPQLTEIAWSGPVVDVVSPAGVAAAGFPAEYPQGVSKNETRASAAAWHAVGLMGIVCRSASLARKGFSRWEGSHERWGELAIFVQNSPGAPTLQRRREDLDWLRTGR